MKVIFLPDYTDKNPYQKELAEALSKYNVNVILSKRFSLFPLFRAVLFYRKPDVLHLHWIGSYILSKNRTKLYLSYLKWFRFVIDILIIRLLGIKLVWTAHELLDEERRTPNLNFSILFFQIIIRLFNQVIVHCENAEDVLISVYKLPEPVKKKFNMVPHGNYISFYENKITKSKARQRLGIDNTSFVFLYFGFVSPYKGIDELIKAFNKLKNPSATLLIAGNPVNDIIRTDVMRLCKKDKRISTNLIFIPDEDIQIYMNATDVVVLPFKEILTSGSVLLAMSFGKAVIAPKIGCISETIDKDGCIFYNPNEEFGLTNAINTAKNVNLISMGEKNYLKVKQFDWDKIAEQTSKVYSK